MCSEYSILSSTYLKWSEPLALSTLSGRNVIVLSNTERMKLRTDLEVEIHPLQSGRFTRLYGIQWESEPVQMNIIAPKSKLARLAAKH